MACATFSFSFSKHVHECMLALAVNCAAQLECLLMCVVPCAHGHNLIKPCISLSCATSPSFQGGAPMWDIKRSSLWVVGRAQAQEFSLSGGGGCVLIWVIFLPPSDFEPREHAHLWNSQLGGHIHNFHVEFTCWWHALLQESSTWSCEYGCIRRASFAKIVPYRAAELLEQKSCEGPYTSCDLRQGAVDNEVNELKCTCGNRLCRVLVTMLFAFMSYLPLRSPYFSIIQKHERTETHSFLLSFPARHGMYHCRRGSGMDENWPICHWLESSAHHLPHLALRQLPCS